jgi:hypothetical protein
VLASFRIEYIEWYHNQISILLYCTSFNLLLHFISIWVER